jgi:hypothetical protein
MTIEQAEADWEDLRGYVRKKCDQHGLRYDEPTEHFRYVYLYECLSGDFSYPQQAYAIQADAALCLRFWSDKYRLMRGASKELDRFLIDRINEARRGA